MSKLLTGVLLLGLFMPSVIFAHPGRTDSYGCHTCKTNCAKWGLNMGEYHCHQAKALPQPKEPVKSHFSETGGSSTPAPEYKQPKVTPIKSEVQVNNEPTDTVPNEKIKTGKVETLPVIKKTAK